MSTDEASHEAVTPSTLPPSSHLNTRFQSAKRSLHVLPRPLFNHDRRNVKPSPSPTAMKEQTATERPALQQRRSNISLFNLFSKPKVEKARGYAGEGPTSTPTPDSPKKPPPPATALKSALKVPTQQQSASSPKELSPPPPPPSQSRAASALSFRSQRPSSSQDMRSKVDEHSTKSQKERKLGASWTPPPLFQAFARSTKNGLAEVSNLSPDKLPSKNQSSKDKITHLAVSKPRKSEESAGSADTRRTNLTLKGTSQNSYGDLPRKIVVLLASGHILQYSEHGPIDRLPEKVLELGLDSAAFASDAISGRLHTLQVIQHVGQKSLSFVSASLLSKFTKRSVNAKRDTANIFLVLPNAEEMESWLHAIRKEIENFSRPGTRSGADVQSLSQTESVKEDPQQPSEKTITQQHRPKTSSSLVPRLSPTIQEEVISEVVPTVNQTSEEEAMKESVGSLNKPEAETEMLAPEVDASNPVHARKTSDAPSVSSSHTASVDQQALNNLRNSVRMSHNSSVTGATSRTNSMTSEPQSNKASYESTTDSIVSSRSPYRSLSSYTSNKRRSTMPLPTTKEAQPVIELTGPPQTPSPNQPSPPSDSPLVGSTSPNPTSLLSGENRSPVLKSAKSMSAFPDNSIIEEPIPNPTPTIAEEAERPESFVGDLPPPSTWSSKPSPKKWTSISMPDPPERSIQRTISAPTLTPVGQPKPTRRSSHAFRLPLKVNPDPSQWRSSIATHRNSLIPEARETQPKIHTLEAKVDPSNKRISIRSVSQPGPEIPHRSSQRHSLFPSPLLNQSNSFEHKIRRPSLPTQPTMKSTEADTQRNSLKRPNSLQVRSNHAPFLSSIRNSGIAPIPGDRTSSLQAETRSSPTRPLKTSPPSSTNGSIQHPTEVPRPASPTDPFTSPRPTAEPDRRTMSPSPPSLIIPKRIPSISPPPSAPLPPIPSGPNGNSFAQQKSMTNKSARKHNSMISALPSLDLGLPVIGLGPPAPPPNAPLPAPPQGAPPGITSRVSSPVPSRPTTAVPMTSTASPTLPPHQVEGLGIQVGS